jgi:hypothetical protein
MREGDRLVLASTQLTTSIVSQCQLMTPGWGGSNSNSYKVRRISVCPLTVEYQHTIAFIANVLGLESVCGPLNDGHMVLESPSLACASTQ